MTTRGWKKAECKRGHVAPERTKQGACVPCRRGDEVIAAWKRDAKRIVSELRAWAQRGHDGWDIACKRAGRRRGSGFAMEWMGPRGRASALRGSRRGGRAAHS